MTIGGLVVLKRRLKSSAEFNEENYSDVRATYFAGMKLYLEELKAVIFEPHAPGAEWDIDW
jgi:hypothetical protein